ncbi:MAG: MerR family transcriptional regulator [Desulfobulbus sp.]
MAPDFPQLPDKVYFRIGEVSALVGVETHVLRYWESEFALIKPHRGKSKQRLYRRKDVQALLLIKDLLHHQGYTISGARKFLKQTLQTHEEEISLSRDRSPSYSSATIMMQQIKHELRGILQKLGEGKNSKG